MYEYQSNNYYGGNFPNQGPGKKSAKEHTMGKKVVTALVCAVLFGITAAATFYIFYGALNNGIAQTEYAETAAGTENTAFAETVSAVSGENSKNPETITTVTDVSDVVSSAMPSVVAITNTQIYEDYRTNGFFRQSENYTYEVQGAGSGVIFKETDDSYYIVTNYHVIEGASELTVTFCDDANAEASIVGYNEDKDLAVISVSKQILEDSTISSIAAISIGDDTELKVGESVIAIGNALGYGQSVTTGIVSALDREVTAQNSDGSITTRELIQTDAAINPGNSGGALLNAKGELVGINSMKYTSEQVEGMGYAIPISDFTEILDTLMEGGDISAQQSSESLQQIPESLPEISEPSSEIEQFFRYYFE